jgi:GNAT superfamily N-acetyltransferase
MDDPTAITVSSADGFTPYRPDLKAACLALFDANCPTFFAVNERADYNRFLGRSCPDYRVRLDRGEAVAAFGLLDEGAPRRRRLNWIMVHPDRHGAGLGRAIMAAVEERSRSAGAVYIDIAASHLSAPFFSRFGAREIARTTDGWGPAMHRVDMELQFANE